MPRRKEQFSFLKRAYKAAGAASSSDLKVGSVLHEFAKYQEGVNKKDAGVIPPTARKRVGYGILPFGVAKPTTPAGKDFYVANISVFSNDWRKGKGLSNADLGYENDGTKAKGFQRPGNFYPAVAKIFVPSGAAVPDVSGITKRTYKKIPGSSYSIPFGIHLTDATLNSEKAQMDAIETTVKDEAIGAKSVSFEPERFTSPSKDVPLGT